MTTRGRDYRITRGESLRFVVSPPDDIADGSTWIAKLDAVSSSGYPVRYTLSTEPADDGPGVTVIVSSALSRVLSTLSTYIVSTVDADDNVTPCAYGSIVVQGADPGGPSTTPSEPEESYGGTHYTADEVISPLSVVCLTDDGERVAVARPPATNALAPLGIATQAAQAGAAVTVRTSGPLSDPTWHWIAGRPVLLGAAGALTQDQPLGVLYLVVIGYAIDADTILIRIGLPIRLAD